MSVNDFVKSSYYVRLLAHEIEDPSVSLKDKISIVQAMAIADLAAAVHWLGTGDAATRMGALELVASAIKETGEHIASTISNTD